MVLESLRPATSGGRIPLVSLMIDNDKGGARRTQSRARSSYAEPQPSLVLAARLAAWLAKNFLFASTKVQHFSCASKFRASIWGDFQHEFAEFERTVIHDARIRNFLPSKITFRR